MSIGVGHGGPSMEQANADLAAGVVQALVAGGVRDVVVSPGSRSAPLALAIADRPDLRAHVVVDERAAAFVGLGLARGSGRPVALLATSGSAGAHWLPALVEADLAGLPLVAITADRPLELLGCGAPQTTEQRGLFAGRTRGFAQLGPAGEGAPRGWAAAVVARLVDQARGATAGMGAGPVHLNVALREPLWAPGVRAACTPRAPRILRASARLDATTADAALAALLDREAHPGVGPGVAPGVGVGRRGIVVAGPRAAGTPDAEPAFARALVELARAHGWPILADPLSGVRFGPHARDLVISSADALLRDPAAALALRPASILRFGQAPTSKTVTTWLAAAAAPTVLVDPAGQWHDPTHDARLLLVADPLDAARALLEAADRQGRDDGSDRGWPRGRVDGWLAGWQRADAAAASALDAALAQGDDAAWEGAAARALIDELEDGARLHVASSLAVRDVDAFGGSSARRLVVTSNRGVNGIDGTVATAAGLSLAAAQHGRPGRVAVLLGDLALVHDVGGVLAARELGAALDLVVIDNGGGAIFEHLPVARHPTSFERFFLTPVASDLRALLEGAGAPCVEVRGQGALRAALQAPRAAPLRAVRVVVDRAAGLRRREAALQAMSRAGAAALAAEEVPCR